MGVFMSSPEQQRRLTSGNPRYGEHSDSRAKGGSPSKSGSPAKAEQYFSPTPQSEDVRKTITVDLRGHSAHVETSNGVFSTSGVDKGTAVLLKYAPQAPASGTFLDLGCGWGPLSLAMAFESPNASVVAIDINERALELTRTNAKNQGLTNIQAVSTDELDPTQTFDLIWSNPPIRVGKAVLHDLLMTYLPRLNPGGAAYLVVQKHLGADSLIPWLAQTLGENYSVSRYDSSKGFRIIEIVAGEAAGAFTPTASAAQAAQAAPATPAAQATQEETPSQI
jgi:16S rRNA G1207 methylase RsmC